MHFLLTTVSAIMDDRAEKQKIVVHPKATTACSLIHQPTVFIALVLAFHAPRITTSFSSSTSISSSSHQSNNAKGTGKQQLFVQLIGPPWGRKRHGPRKQWWMAIHNRQPVWRRAVQQRTQVNWTTLGRRHCTSELSVCLFLSLSLSVSVCLSLSHLPNCLSAPTHAPASVAVLSLEKQLNPPPPPFRKNKHSHVRLAPPPPTPHLPHCAAVTSLTMENENNISTNQQQQQQHNTHQQARTRVWSCKRAANQHTATNKQKKKKKKKGTHGQAKKVRSEAIARRGPHAKRHQQCLHAHTFDIVMAGEGSVNSFGA